MNKNYYGFDEPLFRFQVMFDSLAEPNPEHYVQFKLIVHEVWNRTAATGSLLLVVHSLFAYILLL
jgi:hypothetical protein